MLPASVRQPQDLLEIHQRLQQMEQQGAQQQANNLQLQQNVAQILHFIRQQQGQGCSQPQQLNLTGVESQQQPRLLESAGSGTQAEQGGNGQEDTDLRIVCPRAAAVTGCRIAGAPSDQLPRLTLAGGLPLPHAQLPRLELVVDG